MAKTESPKTEEDPKVVMTTDQFMAYLETHQELVLDAAKAVIAQAQNINPGSMIEVTDPGNGENMGSLTVVQNEELPVPEGTNMDDAVTVIMEGDHGPWAACDTTKCKAIKEEDLVKNADGSMAIVPHDNKGRRLWARAVRVVARVIKIVWREVVKIVKACCDGKVRPKKPNGDVDTSKIKCKLEDYCLAKIIVVIKTIWG